MKSARPAKPRLPDDELSICTRLAEARRKLGLTQTEFANSIDITRASLGSYEEGRVGVRLYVAQRICRQYLISEKWLATGQGHWRAYFDIRHDHEVFDLELSPLMPYGEAFQHLAPIYDEKAKELGGAFFISFGEFDHPDLVQNVFNVSLDLWREEASPGGFAALIKQLAIAASRLTHFARITGVVPQFNEAAWRAMVPEYDKVAREVESAKEERRAGRVASEPAPVSGIHPEAIAAKASHAPSEMVNSLTSESTAVSVAPVNTTIQSWPQLRDALRALATARGARAALAKRFNVTSEAASAWLRGLYAPDADTLFALLRFVQSGEAAKFFAALPGHKPSAKPAVTQSAKAAKEQSNPKKR